MNTRSLLPFYKQQVEQTLLPFWHKAVDHTHGGVFTCFNNRGDTLVSTDKYTWSQGRFLWLWSKMIRMMEENNLDGSPEPYYEQLHKTVRFLEDNVFLENGHCAFLLSETGEKKESIAGEGFDTSIYADCFVVMGMAAYARTTHDIDRFDDTLEQYDRIRSQMESGNIRTEPYPIPPGFSTQDIFMSLLDVSQEMADAAQALDHPRTTELYEHSEKYMNELMDGYHKPNHRIVEMLPADASDEDTLLSRHVNPGHTIECMWFLMDVAQKGGHEDYIRQAIRTIERAMNVGWDTEYGGLLRFVDINGGKPEGRTIDAPYEQLVIDTWGMKLWWPHSEALYATLRSYLISGDNDMLLLYEKLSEYVFETFPNPDTEVGEWIQIRNRKGEPIDEVAALPVKDPYHILRNMLLIIELLEENEQEH